jgi:hypothetical protein
MEGVLEMITYLLCSLAIGFVGGLFFGHWIHHDVFNNLKREADRVIHSGEELVLRVKALKGTIRTMKYVAEERANSIRSYKSANTKQREEIDLLKLDLVNEKMKFDAYVSKKEGTI